MSVHVGIIISCGERERERDTGGVVLRKWCGVFWGRSRVAPAAAKVARDVIPDMSKPELLFLSSVQETFHSSST